MPLLLYTRLHRSIYPSVDQIICGSELRKIILRDEYNKRDDKLSLGGLRVLVYREQIAMENTVIQDTLQNTLYDSL